jgi:hypothetical protein
MRRFALVLGALMMLGVVSGAAAQGSQPAQNPSGAVSGSVSIGDAKAPSANVDVNVKQPAARPGFEININKNERRDDGAALPRAAAGGNSTTVFGLSPTAAVVIAAALLVVVILAIVAMTRGGAETTYR